ncbi:hypothetical protein [Alistipes finegoldii]|uniref:hypothetical protein n=1 Tax=Alistipes finegoldii TaxID=214856 RepID=UPI00248C46ED|nr:hypothetical protein [Alistipes finegoldii]
MKSTSTRETARRSVALTVCFGPSSDTVQDGTASSGALSMKAAGKLSWVCVTQSASESTASVRAGHV